MTERSIYLMQNTLDYLKWRGDLNFEVSPFNDVDMFICSQLSTPDYTDIVPFSSDSVSIGDVCTNYFDTHIDDVSTLGVLQSKFVLPMLKALPGCDRFKDIRLCFAQNRVVQENTEQFCAVTIELPDGSICLSFRGTDDTIIAWKEDFNLATKEIVPAQSDALKYVETVANSLPGKIRICGHSKGGNLAIYAAVNSPDYVKNRIVSAVSFDGPGFNSDFFTKDEYIQMQDKLTTVLSQNSLVGTLLNSAGTVKYVISSVFGPMAHDGFSWSVMGPGFVPGIGLSEASKTFKEAMSDTLGSMTVDEKQAFVDELFDTLLATGAVTITDLTDFKAPKILELLKSLHGDRKVSQFAATMTDYVLKIASDKTEHAIKSASEKTEKALKTASSRTGRVLKSASGKTGKALRTFHYSSPKK